MTPFKVFLLGALLTGAVTQASADDQTNETRLRDAVRQSVMEMRAAQDQAAQAQADLAKAQADKAALQAQLDAAQAKLAEGAAKPVAKPAAAENPEIEAQFRQLQAQNAALQQDLAKLRGSYQTAAQLARSKDQESQQAAAGLRAGTAALQICKTANAKLIGVAEQILHLYESQGFRSVLLRSYEPFLGLEKVKLENMVQDYDDKIHDQEYVASPIPASNASAARGR